ncbi:MAG: nitroreductase family deazaflavin-dependent oxidoreductase [Mycobacterium sp.]|uniref:nitroreductase family deazaflavin-dependent oxidoreductase n=1 Tax=Mycobacterium sp. TaxID=1785 RepID=UPI003F9BF9C6
MAVAPESWPRPPRGAVRVSNRYVLNPVMMRLAGRKHWYAAAITHTGRRSGKTYTTPVVAERVEDGFVIPLPCGTRADWLQNVRAAGRATISVQGHRYEVVEPDVVDAAAALPTLTPRRRRTFQRAGITHYLKVKLAPAKG